MSANWIWCTLIAGVVLGPVAATSVDGYNKRQTLELNLKLQLEQEKTKQALIVANAGCKP